MSKETPGARLLHSSCSTAEGKRHRGQASRDVVLQDSV